MKYFFNFNFFICWFLLAAGQLAPAGVNYSIAVGQAHRASNASGAASGNAPTPPSAAPNAPQTPPENPVLQATLRNIASLRADIAALNDTVTDPPDPAVKTSLLNNLTAAAQGTKPPAATVQSLAEHLMTTLVNRKKLQPQQQTLARDLHAAFNGGHLSATQQQGVLDEVKKLLTEAGAAADAVDQVVKDLKQITVETK